jgi:hypothetical protein
VQTIRACLRLIKESKESILKGDIIEVWACLMMMPEAVAVVLKEEIQNEALKKMGKILKFLKTGTELPPRLRGKEFTVDSLKSFKLAYPAFLELL